MTRKRGLAAILGIVAAVALLILMVAALSRGGTDSDDDAEDRPIVAPMRIATVQGRHVVSLDAATQIENGIAVAHPLAQTNDVATFAAVVLDSGELPSARERYRRAREVSPALGDAIFRDIATRFGDVVAQGLAHPTAATAPLFAGAATLVQVTMPHAPPPQLAYGARQFVRLGRNGRSDRWLYIGRRDADFAGDKLVMHAPKAPVTRALAVPAAAVVWLDGAPWFYRREQGHLFVRVKLVQARAQANGDYATDALHPADEIVIAGAQLLLSEEFRNAIQSEG